MITAKPKQAIVKVVRGFGPEGPHNFALVHGRNGQRPENHFLSQEQVDRIGDKLIAFFVAERIGGRWSLVKPMPDIKGW